MKCIGNWIDLACLALIYLLLFNCFPPALLFLNTHAAGGDTPTHFTLIAYLQHHLLPQGKVLGWYPGNFGGFPAFMFYFPILFLVAALLGAWIPLTEAFKLVTVSGPFLLPISIYAMLRFLGFRYPAPILGTIGAIPFLVNGSNSMWGGNILSTLAGEFSFGFSFALTFAFMGYLFWLMARVEADDRIGVLRRVPVAILLLVLIASSHGFTAIVCGLSATFFLLERRRIVERIVLLVAVFGVTLLLISGWLVQLISYLPYTTAFNIVWRFESWKEPISRELVPGWTLFLAGSAWLLYRRRSGTVANGRAIAFAWWVVVVSVLCFFCSEALRVPDIRFIPFVHLMGCVMGAAMLAEAFRGRWNSRLVPFVALFGAIAGLQPQLSTVRRWADWNYGGFERAPSGPDFLKINRDVAGSVADPRVVYEHVAANDAMGSVRGFESLPFFSGRSTLEGLYLQSSLLSPAVFWLQSLTSSQPSCPFPDFPCAPRQDLRRAYPHLKLFNASELILASESSRREARALSDLYAPVPDSGAGMHDVWRVRGGSGKYVEALTDEPEHIEPRTFRGKFYLWLRRYDGSQRFLYTRPDAFAALHELDRIPPTFAAKSPATRDTLADCQISEDFRDESVDFETTCPGRAHLIKVAYHPGWKVLGGMGPYLASPGMMIVWPSDKKVRLVFDNAGPRELGLKLTALGLVILGLLIGAGWLHPALRQRIASVRVPSLWEKRVFRLSSAVLILGLAAVLRTSAVPGYQRLIREAESDLAASRYPQAQSTFARVLAGWPDEPFSERIRYQLAISYWLEGRTDEAMRVFEELRSRHDPQYDLEATYHLALGHLRLRQPRDARRELDRIVSEGPGSRWAGYATIELGRLAPESQKQKE